jgi:eukaryotic-like serine/threonine-protein kinase
LEPVEEGAQTIAAAERVVLGRYRMERRLGAGGFGVVWQAWDEKLEREVAVKVVDRDSDPRTEREARAAAKLSHPGIVTLYELAGDEDNVYLVSELVDGRSLAELMRAGALSDRDVARVGSTLCDALRHAHSRGVIHRDVKPQNVMVIAEPAAGAGFAKLTDFGVAHIATSDPVTRTGDVVGTLAFMAPEQAEGRRVTGASDVFSLALTLFVAWTGYDPARRLHGPLPSLGRLRRDLPIELCDAIDDALDPDPDYRPAPARLAAVLESVADELEEEGGLVEPATQRRFGLTAVRPREHGRERRLAPRLGAGAAAALLALVVLTQLGPEPPFSIAAACLGAALATALLPRLGWIATATGACLWLASPDAGRDGTALVLALACLPVPLLLPRAGLWWSVPALAPLLGTIGLAPMFVGIAALAPTPWRRAGLGAAGFIWLAFAEVATGRNLLFGIPSGALPRAEWAGSASAALSDAIGPLLSTPALLPAVVWAAFAALLPLLVRGRFLAFDVIGGAAWAAGLVAAQAGLASVMAAETALESARGGVAGPIGAAVVAVALARAAQPSDLTTSTQTANAT